MTHPTTNRYRDLFPEKAVAGYLNGASRAPQLKAVAAAARHALWWREAHPGMPVDKFFGDVEDIKNLFARLINCPESGRIAMTSSASYGVATVAKNLPLRKGQNVIVVEAQFPSNYYSWDVLCKEKEAELRIVKRPAADAGGTWSDRVLAAIDEHTAAVAIAHLHWADGTLYDLAAIRRRTDEVDAWLIVDATQSLGAYPFDVQKIRPDALVAGGYKWLMGPYGCGYAYLGERMDGGKPIEENWINRAGSDDFRNLVNYRSDYRALAGRYSVGEHSNFIMAPMQVAALQQVVAISPEVVQAHCAGLWAGIAPQLQELDVALKKDRAHHLVGLALPDSIDADRFAREVEARGLMLSYRGDSVRVSPNVYNVAEEMSALTAALAAASK
ncbi:aminotransferase class V-fold PLP-dependent enzyme [Neolewinella antarctica]|uniref:Selenocysteine lyase/cysteine desulfurase n=1 Tax=Neolewinella antarctica TaxID=442734 RepID=A0ABX0XAU6_9BACT|nr:aminotransferase class V-fold PLP-dependent enzyme [Neolewinella antarctica]NJC26068.1 selenocysteine lyase/cysteine desulfurase [Neolewinella antarctica]